MIDGQSGSTQRQALLTEAAFAHLVAAFLGEGHGDQNVNNGANAVQLYFVVLNSNSLPEEVRARLVKLAGKIQLPKVFP